MKLQIFISPISKNLVITLQLGRPSKKSCKTKLGVTLQFQATAFDLPFVISDYF